MTKIDEPVYKPLGKKQFENNENFLYAEKHIEEIVSKEELDALTDKTLKRMRKTLKGKRWGYGWSGGKDSSVLLALIDRLYRVGTRVGGLIGLTQPELEYPAFERWLEEGNLPEDCKIFRSRQDLKWLAKNPELLWPRDSALLGRWWQPTHWAAQTAIARDNEADYVVMGRRLADGNVCGKDGLHRSSGRINFNCIYDWRHEDVIAYIHYYDLPKAPWHDWPNSYVCGSGCWPERVGIKSEREGWELMKVIDPTILEVSAPYFPLAKELL